MQSSADSAATEKNGGDSRAQQKSGPPQQPQQQHHSGGGGATFQPHFPFANGHSTSAASSLVPHHHGFMAGPPETMQAFANLGLFCTPAGAHPQFPMATPSGGGGAALHPQLAAAAAAAAGYSQRLMGAQLPTAASQNGGLLRRNGFPSQHQTASSSSVPPHPSAASSSSINRSQRCGVCRGCQCKPCGQCTYCQDSPQFGGPGVKKQSCIERRCLRVLENRLQRDAPTFKARIGCNACEDCRSPDCQICLVCLDRRFFHSKYMAGALCAKKRCNNATALELPISSDRSSLKRTSDYGTAQHLAKRQILIPGTHPSGAQQLNSNIARILSAASDQQSQQKFGPAFGRCSGANSGNSSNSSLSEGQSTTPPSLMAVPQLGRHFWQGQMPSQMLLPGQYHFDAQMASLAAVAVGFPQHHGMTQHYAHPYQPKLLSAGYPKYEYLDEGTAVAMTNGPSTADSTGNGADGQMGAMQSNAGTAENLLVPPSYSDVQKVVLQPL